MKVKDFSLLQALNNIAHVLLLATVPSMHNKSKKLKHRLPTGRTPAVAVLLSKFKYFILFSRSVYTFCHDR